MSVECTTVEQPVPPGKWRRSYHRLFERRLGDLMTAHRDGDMRPRFYFQNRYYPPRMTIAKIRSLAWRLATRDVERAINERKEGEGVSRHRRGVGA